jgi:hypothetical protein
VSFLVDVKKWDAKLQITSLQSLPSETSANSYALTAEQSKTEDGGLELEFVLSAKPNSNSINIPFSKENITLLYQPPLTEEFKQEDCEIWTSTHIKLENGIEFFRPENVVGSYAVYHSSKRNNMYKTGKICHIFRPKLIDADGKTAWAEFNRDANETNVLTITLPQAFLDSARYPVTVDPTFGKTSIGASSNSWSQDWAVCSKATLSENGTVTQLSAYNQATSTTINATMVLYNHDAGNSRPGNVQDTSDEQSVTTTAAWRNFTVNGGLSAAIYWIGIGHSGGFRIWYDTSGTNDTAYKSFTYPSFPNPFGSCNFYTRIYSFYATYTSGATVQTVSDSLSLAEAVLRDKTLILTDSLGLADASYGDKFLLLGDSASLSEFITVIIGQVMKYVTDAASAADLVDVLKTLKMSDTVTLADVALTPSRVLQVLEAIGAADNAVVNKVLQITETVSLAEIVEVGTGGVKKTKLFLILGDLTVQLTGD